jgi:hypothetical protein
MIKFTFTRNKTADTSRTEVSVVSAPVLHRVGHAIRTAPTHHRVMTFIVFTAVWAVFEYVLHYEMAAKGAELFGMAPAADKLLRLVIGDGE